jgi:predicted Fe-Mo cluster-binding NifX family protein
MTNIMRLIPVEESLFYGIPAAGEDELTALRKSCAAILPQMYHCRQCRADAIGTLEHDISPRWTGEAETGKTAGETTAPRLFAAASSGGVLVDQHFGHVSAFYVYEYSGGVVRFRERRELTRFCGETGGCGRHERLGAVIAALEDCEAVLASMIGEAPKLALEQRGIAAYISCDSIENAVREAARLQTAKYTID